MIILVVLAIASTIAIWVVEAIIIGIKGYSSPEELIDDAIRWWQRRKK